MGLKGKSVLKLSLRTITKKGREVYRNVAFAQKHTKDAPFN